MVDKDQGLLCELSWCDVGFKHLFGSDVVGFALQHKSYMPCEVPSLTKLIFLCACIHVLVYAYMCVFVGACALAACSHHAISIIPISYSFTAVSGLDITVTNNGHQYFNQLFTSYIIWNWNDYFQKFPDRDTNCYFCLQLL